MVGNSICGKLLNDIFPNTKQIICYTNGEDKLSNMTSLCLHLLLKKNNFILSHTPSDIYIFPSSWRGRIILSIIPRILVIVLKGKSKHVSILELWLSSYKIKADMCKKTDMYSLLKF